MTVNASADPAAALKLAEPDGVGVAEVRSGVLVLVFGSRSIDIVVNSPLPDSAASAPDPS
jgi:hypothetical protein